MSLDDYLATRVSIGETEKAQENIESLRKYVEGIANMIGSLVMSIGEDVIKSNRLPPELQFLHDLSPAQKQPLVQLLIQRATEALNSTLDGNAPVGTPSFVAALVLSPESVSRDLRKLYVMKMMRWHQKYHLPVAETADNHYVKKNIITEAEAQELLTRLQIGQVVELS